MLPCSATLSPTLALGIPYVYGPEVQPQGVAASGGDLLQPLAAVLGEQVAARRPLILSGSGHRRSCACTAGEVAKLIPQGQHAAQVSNTMTDWSTGLDHGR